MRPFCLLVSGSLSGLLYLRFNDNPEAKEHVMAFQSARNKLFLTSMWLTEDPRRLRLAITLGTAALGVLATLIGLGHHPILVGPGGTGGSGGDGYG